MGDFRITIDAVGAHGCEREKGNNETVHGCRRLDCPDCLTAEFVSKLARTGTMIKGATLEHWPGQPNTVVDAFYTDPGPSVCQPRKRTGKF